MKFYAIVHHTVESFVLFRLRRIHFYLAQVVRTIDPDTVNEWLRIVCVNDLFN